MTKPFLKWPGNKYRISKEIAKSLPAGRRLVEPFAGSGSIFLNTDYEEYLLCDLNPDLIDLFNVIKEEENFIEQAREYFVDENNEKDRYYELRELFNHIRTDPSKKIEKSKIFLYLNKHGFNGLCRYNAKGGYNVPFGSYNKPYFPEKELWEFKEKSKRATFLNANYVDVFENYMKDGDVFYCDPPYAPIESQKSNFTAYFGNVFDLESQKDLAKRAEENAKIGVPTVISNHDTEFCRDIYKNANAILEIDVARNISRDGANRAKVKEIIVEYHS